MELWVKEYEEDGCSVGLCMNLRASGPATRVSSSGNKHPTTSITPFEKLSICPSWQSRLKYFDLHREILYTFLSILVRCLIGNNHNKFDEEILEALHQSFSILLKGFLC